MPRFILILFCLSFLATAAASAEDKKGGEVAATYVHMRPYGDTAGCNCEMKGGSLSAAYHATNNVALVGEVAVQRTPDIGSSRLDMVLTTYLAGPRVTLRHPRNRMRPFVEAFFGGAYARGSLLSGTSGLNCSATTFAMNAGAGVDVRLSRRIGWRPVQASYLLTTFNTGRYDHQNNLRLATGLVFRFATH